MFSFQLVGTCVPVAAGLAWAVKHGFPTPLGNINNDIVAVFFGDAATANGQWHEGMNLAAIQRVPLLLVCENNRMAGNVRPKDYLPVPFVTQRAAAYGIQAAYVDGNDIEAVIEAARGAVDYVRDEMRPFLLECETTRLGRHKQGQGDIRGKEEMAALALRDPLLKASIPEERRAAIRDEINSIIESVRSGPDAALPGGTA